MLSATVSGATVRRVAPREKTLLKRVRFSIFSKKRSNRAELSKKIKFVEIDAFV
jgi:hypothetical protein